jgi:uncharacterized protein
MEYRRFGKTEKDLSVITLGGMRFKHGWDEPRHLIPNDTQEQCNLMVQMAIDQGINHIETAYGYTKSETVYGRAFNALGLHRQSFYLMTKGNSHKRDDMRRLVEEQLTTLQTDYLDFYGWHGINNHELMTIACATGGPVEELLRMKEEGLIKHVGFSTHAPLGTIIETIETGLFEFVNLHYYYFNQRNEAAIALAHGRDMGVFIISPNDKGGQLFNAPQKVRQAIPHATPIQWNSRFCLSNPWVHTLSFGFTEPHHFDEMKGIFPTSVPLSVDDATAKTNLDKLALTYPYTGYEGHELANDPSGINIPEMLRLHKLWKCYDMLDFARYRYREYKEPNHWMPGVYATPENIAKIDHTKVPSHIPLKQILEECHQAFYQAPHPKVFDAAQITLAK